MRQEVITRDAIITQLQSVVVDRASVAWATAVGLETQGEQLVEVKNWLPFTSFIDLVEKRLISSSVHAFVAWGDFVKLHPAHNSKNPVSADVEFILQLATINIDDPQGNLLKCEETILDALSNMNNVEYSDAGNRFSTIDDRSITFLTSRYVVSNVKLDS